MVPTFFFWSLPSILFEAESFCSQLLHMLNLAASCASRDSPVSLHLTVGTLGSAMGLVWGPTTWIPALGKQKQADL